MNKLRSSLEVYKSSLDIVLDMVSLSIAREIKVDTEEIRNDTTAIKEDTTQILAEIARLQARLPEKERVGGANGFALQRYLDNLTSYAESSWDRSDVGSDHSTELEASQNNSPLLSPADISPPVEISMTPIEALERETSVMSSSPQNLGSPVALEEPAVTHDTQLKIETAGAKKPQSRAPSLDGIPSQRENRKPQVDSGQQHDNTVSKQAYTVSKPTDIQPENRAGINGHKRSNTIGGFFKRSNSIFGGKRNERKELFEDRQAISKEERTLFSKSYSTTNVTRTPSVGRASRRSTDSRRSISFGSGKRRSGSMSGSEVTLGEKSRRFSLLPAGFSLKAIGIGADRHSAVVNPPENEGETSEVILSFNPGPPKFARVAGFELNAPRPFDQPANNLGPKSSSRYLPPPYLPQMVYTEAANDGSKNRRVRTELAGLAGVDFSREAPPVVGVRLEPSSSPTDTAKSERATTLARTGRWRDDPRVRRTIEDAHPQGVISTRRASASSDRSNDSSRYSFQEETAEDAHLSGKLQTPSLPTFLPPINFREPPSEPLIDLSNRYPRTPLGAEPKRPTEEPLQIPTARDFTQSGLPLGTPVTPFDPSGTTLQPLITKETSPAMKWANKYDKDAIREAHGPRPNHSQGRLVKPTMQSDVQVFGSDDDVSGHVDRHYKKTDPDYGRVYENRHPDRHYKKTDPDYSWVYENRHPDRLRHDLPSLNATQSNGAPRKVMDFFRRRGRERE